MICEFESMTIAMANTMERANVSDYINGANEYLHARSVVVDDPNPGSGLILAVGTAERLLAEASSRFQSNTNNIH
jgi:hypothetical protein